MILLVLIMIFTIFAGFIYYFVINHYMYPWPFKSCLLPGMKRAGMNCYRPSGTEGRPCNKSTDCPTKKCVLVNWGKGEYKGECRDSAIGCYTWIDEDGEYGHDGTVAMECAD